MASSVLSLASKPLTAGTTIDFGTAEPGSVTQTLTLSNPCSSSITVGAITVTGAGFSGPKGISAPVVMPPNQSIPFHRHVFTLDRSGSAGTLAVDHRFQLNRAGRKPPAERCDPVRYPG